MGDALFKVILTPKTGESAGTKLRLATRNGELVITGRPLTERQKNYPNVHLDSSEMARATAADYVAQKKHVWYDFPDYAIEVADA